MPLSLETDARCAMLLRPIEAETDPRILALYRRLADAKRRLTRPRANLLRALVSLDRAASAKELHEIVGAATCDLVTVYRSLLAMERLGILQRTFGATGDMLFSIAETPEAVFLISKKSGEAERIELPPSLEIDTAVRRIEDGLKALGYTEVSHVVQFSAFRPEERPMPPEPMPEVKEKTPPAKKSRKLKKPSKAELAREKVAAFLDERFGAKV